MNDKSRHFDMDGILLDTERYIAIFGWKPGVRPVMIGRWNTV